MGGKAIAFLRWEVLRLQRRFGWPLWVGVGLALAALWCGYQAWALNAEASRLTAFRNGSPTVVPPRPSQPVTEDNLKNYYAALPHEEERFAVVKRILLAAEENGVVAQQVDYKLETDAQTKVTRYQMTLPMQGEFSRIQAFLVDVLNENRSVSIDSLNIKRESLERSEVDAQVQFSILMVNL